MHYIQRPSVHIPIVTEALSLHYDANELQIFTKTWIAFRQIALNLLQSKFEVSITRWM